MKTYIAKWPDGTISILKAHSVYDLFWRLDEEANPCLAKVYLLNNDFHIQTTIVNNSIVVDCDDHSRKRINFDVDEMHNKLIQQIK